MGSETVWPWTKKYYGSQWDQKLFGHEQKNTMEVNGIRNCLAINILQNTFFVPQKIEYVWNNLRLSNYDRIYIFELIIPLKEHSVIFA